jgi:molybdenum cofactor cytidylyltransferase
MIALVGAGGKTTLMFRLAAELTATGRRVVTTMTTKIYTGQMALTPASLVLADEGVGLARLPALLAEHRHVLVVGRPAAEPEKMQGVEPALLDSLVASGLADAIILEADGARRLPFKAPADHEPVIPARAAIVVPVVGLGVIGQPLDGEHVHRPERVAALTGAALGDRVTPALVAAVLAHPQGGAQGRPPSARLVPFLNAAEGAERLAAAREIARCLLESESVDSVLIGSAQANDPVAEVWSRIGVVVLAAGEARRFGALKQVLPWRGVPLVAHVTRQALVCPDVAHVAVTVGAGAERVTAVLAPLTSDRLQIIPVPDWAAGQSASVKAGMRPQPPSPPPPPVRRRGEGPGEGGLLFLLADQPGVSPALLSALIQRHRETLAPVVAPRHAGQRGNPVLFDRATFGEFAGLTGDIGARPIIQAHAAEAAWVDWATPEILQDIDTGADYRPPTG